MCLLFKFAKLIVRTIDVLLFKSGLYASILSSEWSSFLYEFNDRHPMLAQKISKIIFDFMECNLAFKEALHKFKVNPKNLSYTAYKFFNIAYPLIFVLEYIAYGVEY